jgi:tRNA dimethylallyltransferase
MFIEDRTRMMFSAGWHGEVRGLMRVVPESAPAWNASGYRAVREMVQGLITFEAAMERVVIETRQYAKRQRTWFRHQLAGADVTRLDVHAETFEAELRAWWEGGAA